MNLGDLVANMTGKLDGRLGYTTTVKDQVDSIQNNTEHFKRVLQTQRKQQGQLQFQIKKLQENTKTSFQELHKQISARVQYLTDMLRGDNNAQNKQFEYLQLQNSNLLGEHDKLNELACTVGGRTQQVQNNVGL